MTTLAVHLLSIHVPYACGRSGACCASGWDIPIDRPTRATIARALADGALALPAAATGWCHDTPAPPPPDVAVLARGAEGDCVFLRRATPIACAIHDACGHAALPLACRQFPRVTLADDRGWHVTLSHYCPTVAALACADDGPPLRLVAQAPGWQAEALSPGLDARGHWPPLLRPGLMASLAAWTQWERFCVDTMARRDVTPASALAALAAAARTLRAWKSCAGPLDTLAVAVLDHARTRALDAGASLDAADALRDWHAAWATVPPDRALAPEPPDVAAVAAAIADLSARPVPVARYLAAKCVASWMAYQGHGLLAFVASVRAAAHVLAVEAARSAPRDAPTRVREAMRRADLLLVHLADPAGLAAAWNRAERPSRT